VVYVTTIPVCSPYVNSNGVQYHYFLVGLADEKPFPKRHRL
jgi:hypothetical protein